MTVLSLRDLSFSYGGRPLIEHAEFQLTAGERVALVGRNGTGKSTLLKLIAGELKPDHGAVEVPPTVRIATQTQEVPADLDGTIFEEVAAGLGSAGPAVAAAYRLHHEAGLSPDEHALLEARAETLDHEHAWQWEHDVLHTLGRMQLDPARRCAELSSGMKRRVLLARALVTSPDVLLLDEPTNHLDIEAIQWLEDFLSRYEGTLVFITHDRVFLQKVARRIVEIDRARLFDWTCDYATFLERKEAALAAEEQQQDLFDKKLAVEEAWIRQGVKARRVRNEGRVRALMEMRKERAARRAKVGVASAELHQAERSGQLVLQTKDLSYEIGGRTIVSGLTTTILRGDKVGLIGPNGSGKTTLLKLLLGELTPTSGTVRHGTRLEIAYFDQLRTQLDGEKSVIDNVSPGEDQLLINGRKRHIISYLEDYLFTPERSRTLVRYLSGGERNRLMLARLLAKPSNLLVLDEPTNDLDAETLELLESVLVEYGGTILLVSHDRAFLNHVATQTLAFEGDAVVREYTGGYDDYVRQRAVLQSASTRPREVATSAGSDGASREPARAASSATTGPRPKPLSFKEERERAELPAKIETWEATQAQLEAEMASPSFYQQGKDQIAATTQRLEQLHADLAKAYERWDELEARAQAAGDAR